MASVELIEIREFLAEFPPFSLLDEDALAALVAHMSIRYLRRGSPFPPEDAQPEYYVVRKGAIEQRDADDRLLAEADQKGAARGVAHEGPGIVDEDEQEGDRVVPGDAGPGHGIPKEEGHVGARLHVIGADELLRGRQQAVGMMDRQRLHDAAAHGNPEDMRLGDPQGIHQSHHVARHVDQGIGRDQCLAPGYEVLDFLG